jgi:hypothetical protein
VQGTAHTRSHWPGPTSRWDLQPWLPSLLNVDSNNGRTTQGVCSPTYAQSTRLLVKPSLETPSRKAATCLGYCLLIQDILYICTSTYVHAGRYAHAVRPAQGASACMTDAVVVFKYTVMPHLQAGGSCCPSTLSSTRRASMDAWRHSVEQCRLLHCY